MKALTREWVDKAEGDLGTAERELIVRENPNYDAVCFHAQQCAEKCMKALLQERDVVFGKTHDLLTLLDALRPAEPSLEELRGRLDVLTDYAVDPRYPGGSADEELAAEAIETAREARRRALLLLGVQA